MAPSIGAGRKVLGLRAQRKKTRAAGPGSRPMAAMLLESLSRRGRLADRDRAARDAKLDDHALAEAPLWLPSDAIARMFGAASVDVPVARALGHRMIAAESLGMPLYGLGLATPEKAYRRVQALLPREAPDAEWATEEILGESARLAYRPHADAHPNGSVFASCCAMRRGMLEAIPTVYGLLPATVRDERCVARGDDVCRYEVRWRRNERRGLGLGFALGAVTGTAAAAIGMTVAGLTVAHALFGALVLCVLGATLGRCVDLIGQLEAVAGARRGQLALFDQVDDQLAAKLDALARADSKLEDEPGFPGVASPRLGSDGDAAHPSERDRNLLAAAQTIHAASGDLECWFDKQMANTRRRKKSRKSFEEGRVLVREVRDWATRITTDIAAEGQVRHAVDLAAVVARAVAATRPMLMQGAIVNVVASEPLEPVRCDPVQIEQVVSQLVRNAIEASQQTASPPEAEVTLQPARGGVEVAVEDRGAGIESQEVDEVFDPFFGEASSTISTGFGLPVCLRIVEAHGGELRIETENRNGTRVSILLPEDGGGGNRDDR